MTIQFKEMKALPGFDGTGPVGKGPMTGRCEGYCILKLNSDEALDGYAGADLKPVRLEGEAVGQILSIDPSGWIALLKASQDVGEQSGNDRTAPRNVSIYKQK